MRGAFSLRDGLVHVFYNLRLILICVVGGLVLGIAAAALSPPRYVAESLLLLRVGATEAAQEGLNGPQAFQSAEAVQRVLQSDAEVIRSQPVVEAALARIEHREDASPMRSAMSAGRPSAKALAKFNRALSVVVEPNSNIIRVSFKSTDRDRALRAVEALVEAYAAQRAGLYVNGARTRQDQEIDRYAGSLDQTEATILEVRRDHDVLDVETDVKLASDRLDALSQRDGQARERLGAVQAELAATNRSLASAPDRVLDSQERTNATPNDEARNTLLRLRQDRAHLVEQYAADWPGLSEIDAKIAAAQAQIVENSQDIRSSDRTVRNPVADLLAARRAGLVVEQASLARQIAELSGQIEAARARVADLRNAEMRLHDLERTRTASETIYRSLLIGRAGSSLEDQAVDDQNTSLRVVQPATAPMTGRSLRPLLVLGGLLVGLAFSVVAATIATLMRQTFVTPGEAEKGLGLAVLQTLDAGGDDLRTPEGQAAIRNVATLLRDAEIDGRPLQIVQIIGDDAQAKSRLGLALAQVLSQSLELWPRADRGPVLLIDFDAADHYRRKAGPDTVRRLPVGTEHLDVARSAAPGLWAAVSITGAIGEAPSSLQAAEGVFAVLREAFAFVVVVARRDFDAPLSRRLNPLVDASVLLVAAEATRAPTARRMHEAVLSSGGDLLGVILTRRRFHIPEAMLKWL